MDSSPAEGRFAARYDQEELFGSGVIALKPTYNVTRHVNQMEAGSG